MTLWTCMTVMVLFHSCVTALDSCDLPSDPEDRRPDPFVLKLLHLNAHRLSFPAESPPVWNTTAMAQEHTQKVAGIVARAGASVVELSEVRDCDALQSLLQSWFPMADSLFLPFFPASASVGNFSASNSTPMSAPAFTSGFVSQLNPTFPPASLSDLMPGERLDFPIAGSRCADAPRGTTGPPTGSVLRLQAGDVAVLLVGVQLDASASPSLDSATSESCARREAQAELLRRFLLAEGRKKGLEVLVSGDFNDFDGSIEDASRSQPRSGVMSILRNLDPLIAGDELVNAGAYFSPDTHGKVLFTRMDSFSNKPVAVDHVLLSRGLLMHLVKVSYLTEGYNVSTQPIYSDHYGVLIELNLSIDVFHTALSLGTLAFAFIVLVLSLVALAFSCRPQSPSFASSTSSSSPLSSFANRETSDSLMLNDHLSDLPDDSAVDLKPDEDFSQQFKHLFLSSDLEDPNASSANAQAWEKEDDDYDDDDDDDDDGDADDKPLRN